MNISWEVVGTLGLAAAAWLTIMGGIVKWLLDSHMRALQERLANIDQKLAQQNEDGHRVEKDLLKLRAELPLHYVRKEDAIRSEVAVHAKLDALSAKIDALKGPHAD